MGQQPGTPGTSIKNDDWVVRQIQDLQREVRELKAADPFTPMGLSAQSGGINLNGFLHALRANASLSLSMDPSVSAFIVCDASGTEIARLGLLAHANPGAYGIEIYYSGSWSQVGSGNVDWVNITNKPSSFTPSGHHTTHESGGSDVVTVAGANVTGEVPQARGSNYGYNHAVGGSSFFAAWFGNDANFNFGTNTSSIRGKRNVRRHRISPERILALKPVVYEKPANGDYVEYGLIAEQVNETMPEIVQWMDGKIHGVRYDLLAVALLDAYRELYEEVHSKDHKSANKHHPPEVRANNSPPHPERPHPYTIEGD